MKFHLENDGYRTESPTVIELAVLILDQLVDMDEIVYSMSDQVSSEAFALSMAACLRPFHFDTLINDIGVDVDITPSIHIFYYNDTVFVKYGGITVGMSLGAAVRRGLGIVMMVEDGILVSYRSVRRFAADVTVSDTLPHVYAVKSKI